jgi:hypothetical protein
MAKLEQMPGGEISSELVVWQDSVHLDVGQIPVDHDNGHILVDQKIERVRLVARCDKDDAVHLFLAENIHIKQFPLNVQLGVA